MADRADAEPRNRPDLAGKLARFPRLGLAHLPTPLEPMRDLSRHLGGPQLWVKREDCTGLGLGGNKLRKLDTVLREALDAGRRHAGLRRRHPVEQPASGGGRRRQARPCLRPRGLSRAGSRRLAPDYAAQRQRALNRLFGATLHPAPWTGDRNAAILALAERLTGQRPASPTSCPTASRRARGRRLRDDRRRDRAAIGRRRDSRRPPSCIAPGAPAPRPAWWLAPRALTPKPKVIGIDIDAEPARVRADVSLRPRRGRALEPAVRQADVEVVAGHAGPAYGMPHAATIEAIKLAGRLEGLVLDPVYSGKGLAGLIALDRPGPLAPR